MIWYVHHSEEAFIFLMTILLLRNISAEQLNKEATLFQPKKAWWYIPNDLGVIHGSETFTAPNPPYGAVFTYYLKEEIKHSKISPPGKRKETN